MDLESAFELKNDFIGRWVESRNGRQQKYSAFNDVEDYYRKHYKNGVQKSAIESFYTDVKEDLVYYNLIINDNVEQKAIRNKVRFLLNAGNQKYTINLLIALFRHFSYKGNGEHSEEIIGFITAYERLVLFILLNRYVRFSNSQIYAAINFLNQNQYPEALNALNESLFEEEELKKLINDDIKDNTVAKLLVAKYIWSKEAQIDDDLVAQDLYFDKCTLEHIIPQKPKKGSNWLRDFSPVFLRSHTYLLGNMTLLTHKINATAKNYDFEVKKQAYRKTKLAMTKEIAAKDSIDEGFIKERHQAMVTVLYDDLRLV